MSLIELQGAVRRDGKPFVIVLTDGEQTGQMTPGEAVNFGTRAIQAAIEAERDAATVLGIKQIGLGEREAAALLTMIREYRSQVDPDPRQDYTGPQMDEPK
jgi:hypothetical protein